MNGTAKRICFLLSATLRGKTYAALVRKTLPDASLRKHQIGS